MSLTTVLSEEPAATAAPARRAALLGGGARLALGLLLPLALAFGWEIAVAAGFSSGRLLPPPSRVGAALWTLAASGELWTHVEATLIRVGLGFAFGAGAGILAGALTATLPPYAGWSIRASRPCVRCPRSPGCHCSSCGSASWRRRRWP
ncbi:hypothetical protein GCM10025880_30640 [Methylorubrum aminovorans]|nr:hypothetical protein GCM10025880_30640 [Methylorubrum aminovorans]